MPHPLPNTGKWKKMGMSPGVKGRKMWALYKCAREEIKCFIVWKCTPLGRLFSLSWAAHENVLREPIITSSPGGALVFIPDFSIFPCHPPSSCFWKQQLQNLSKSKAITLLKMPALLSAGAPLPWAAHPQYHQQHYWELQPCLTAHSFQQGDWPTANTI